jgi:hypothetical protein
MLESCFIGLTKLLSLHGSSPGPWVGTWEMEIKETDDASGDAPTTKIKDAYSCYRAQMAADGCGGRKDNGGSSETRSHIFQRCKASAFIFTRLYLLTYARFRRSGTCDISISRQRMTQGHSEGPKKPTSHKQLARRKTTNVGATKKVFASVSRRDSESF